MVWYVFNAERQPVAMSRSEPNHGDLATRGEIAVASAADIPLMDAELTADNQVQAKTPAPVVLTVDQQIAALDAEFAPRFAALRDAYTTAQMNDDSTTVAARVADKAALEAEYVTRLEAIYSGS